MPTSTSGLRTSRSVARRASRSIVAQVVRRRTIDDEGQTAPGGERREFCIEFGLAEVATVGGVGAVARVVHLFGVKNFVMEGKARDEGGGLGSLMRGEARRFAGYAEGTRAEFVIRHVGHVRAIDAATESHQHRPHLAEQRTQGVLFRQRFGRCGVIQRRCCVRGRFFGYPSVHSFRGSTQIDATSVVFSKSVKLLQILIYRNVQVMLTRLSSRRNRKARRAV